MKAGSAAPRSAAVNALGWVFGIAFLVIGVLNVLLIHPVPGAFYLLLSLVYLPTVDTMLRKRFGFAIPLGAKLLLGLVVLWGTLAMSELADRFD